MITIEYEYNGLILNESDSFLYHVDQINGIAGSPAIREARENKSASNGQHDYGQLLAERLITMHGELLAHSATERDLARQILSNAFITDGQYRWLKWQVSGDYAKQVYCKVLELSFPEAFYKNSPYLREFIINFIAADPLIYSQTENIDTIYIPSATGGRSYAKTYAKAYGTIQTGGKATLNNLGNFDSLPTIRLYGPLTIPKIRNNSDGAKEIQIDTTVAAGDYLEVDFTDHTIMLNGTTSRYNYLNSNSQWWVIKAGNNDIEFRDSGGDTDGYAQITWRSAWL